MKLVEILARELKEWPAGNTHSWQDFGGEVRFSHTIKSDFRASEMCHDHVRNLREPNPRTGVTRADWEAERARIAKPASKPNKDGWIRHRGGKCPVEAGVLVDYRMRDGEIMTQPAGRLVWSHDSDIGDIMAYRIYKPVEQLAPVSEPAERKCEGRACEMPDAESHSKKCLLDAVIDQGLAAPFQWRDRITEIDSTVEALEEERVALVQRLEGEGFRLIERAVQPVEDMSDWRNWKAGDLVKCVSFKGKGFARLTIGKIYKYDGNGCIVDDDGDSQGLPVIEGTALKFHSRPSK